MLRTLSYAAGMHPWQAYRQRTTDIEAVLTVNRIVAIGIELWWQVRLLDAAEKAGVIEGQPAVQWLNTREQAEMAYRAQFAALRRAGWVRVA